MGTGPKPSAKTFKLIRRDALAAFDLVVTMCRLSQFECQVSEIARARPEGLEVIYTAA